MTPTPPPPHAEPSYPGSGFTSFGSRDGDRLSYDQTPPGQTPRAGLGARTAAFALDSVIVWILPVAALVALRSGPRRIEACAITEDGTIAVLGQEGVTTGLCEVPTDATFAVAGVLGLLSVLAWLAYTGWEGRTGAAVGKRTFGLRTVDVDGGAPIGARRSVGRNLARAIFFAAFLVPFVVDHLWPLWDRAGQTLHDKVASSVVVPVAIGDAP